MRKIFRVLIILTLLLVSLPTMIQAQEQEPVVYGVFFYAPACPHCQDVIENHWDAIQTEFGDQLMVIFVNVQVAEGARLMRSARVAMGIEASGVPMLIIGENVLVGSQQIPNLAPNLIRNGLANGGIGFPPIPNIEATFLTALENNPNQIQLMSESHISSDPANIVAIVILLALVLSFLMVIGVALNPDWQQIITGNLALTALLMTIIGGIGLSLSLLFGSDNLLVTGMILMMVAAFTMILLWLMQKWSLEALSDRTIPLLLITGIIVAAYMSYVEMTASEAVCGVVGQCNVVQQSDYARILGIPIGIIGILGYIVLFFIWLFGQGSQQAYLVLFMLISGGVAFSIYLTYLEPFVIGATCVWCLTSAIIMLALLWLVAPMALDSLQERSKNAV